MSSMTKTVQTSSVQSIIAGLVYAFIGMGIFTIIVSVFLLLTSIKEESLTFYIFLIHSISVLIGGYVTGKRAGRRGWYYGGLLGLFYIIIIYLVGFLAFDSTFDLYSLFMLVLAFAIGALGGIFGVNSHK